MSKKLVVDGFYVSSHRPPKIVCSSCQHKGKRTNLSIKSMNYSDVYGYRLALGFTCMYSVRFTRHHYTLHWYSFYPVLLIHGDNDAVFISKKLKATLVSRNIRTSFTTTYTPQRNTQGRQNLTFFNMVRTISLPRKFWGLALLYCRHIRNNVATIKHPTSTATQLVTGKRSSMHRFRVFGCVLLKYYSVNTPKKSLDDRKRYDVFLGFDSFCYRVYDVGNHKLISTRDVVFDENLLYKDLIKNNTTNNQNGSLLGDGFDLKFSPCSSMGTPGTCPTVAPELALTEGFAPSIVTVSVPPEAPEPIVEATTSINTSAATINSNTSSTMVPLEGRYPLLASATPGFSTGAGSQRSAKHGGGDNVQPSTRATRSCSRSHNAQLEY
eukprot:Pgem_evm1s18382